jgi:hypothetical protein
MSAAIAAQLVGADFLKLRKKRGTVIWALALALVPLILFFVVRAIQHSSNPGQYGPAGGEDGYLDGLRIVGLFFGPLAAIMIGAEGGAGDVAAGVFRDLIVTGRSRTALFFSRLPAAVALTWIVVGIAYALVWIGTFALAGNAPTPSTATMLNGLGVTALSTGVICAVAVGFAALTSSRPATLTALIGWQLVASPLLAGIGSLGDSRKLILSQAILHFSPVHIGDHGSVVSMSQATALLTLAGWLVVFLALGAWRTRTMDA